MEISLWSDTNPGVKEILSPLSTVEWTDLSLDDKRRMWQYLQRNLFDPEPLGHKGDFVNIECNYKFYGSLWDNEQLVEIIALTLNSFNNKYKRQSYAQKLLNEKTFDAACSDFHNIFISQPQDVVFEMITLFSNAMIMKGAEKSTRKKNERLNSYEKRKEEATWARFDKFSLNLNEVLNDFGINYQLTRTGIIPADEPEVITEIYKPTLKKLSNRKWSPVNRDLRDSFSALNSDNDGSGALTHALSAVQAFLQILVVGKTGKGNTSELIKEGIKKKIIPDDEFSMKIIGELKSFWAKERQDKADAHPKNQTATKKQAKLVISLVMIFIDYIL